MAPKTDDSQSVKESTQPTGEEDPRPVTKPSFAARSAEGATGYAGLNGDRESQAARRFIDRRVAQMRIRYTRPEPKP